VGLLKFQGQLGHHAAQGRCGVPFLLELFSGLGEPALSWSRSAVISRMQSGMNVRARTRAW
jgi:hypothetical protein